MFGRNKRFEQRTYIEPVQSGPGCFGWMLRIALLLILLFLIAHVL